MAFCAEKYVHAILETAVLHIGSFMETIFNVQGTLHEPELLDSQIDACITMLRIHKVS